MLRAAADPAEHRALHDVLVTLSEVATAARAELITPDATVALLARGRWIADLGWALLGARARGDDVLAGALVRRIGDELAPRN